MRCLSFGAAISPEIVVDISFEDRKVDLVEEGYDLNDGA